MTVSLWRPAQALMLVMTLALFLADGKAQETQRTINSDATRHRPKTVSLLIDHLTIRAVLADTDASRTQGLLGWDSISDDLGMLLDFVFPGNYAIHMQGMKFPIDAIWIDSDGIIQLIYEEIPPNSGRIYPSMFSCRYCLEVKAGFCKRNQIKMGQKVRFVASE